MSNDKKSEFAVKTYLKNNPDFFLNNTEFLTQITVHESQGDMANFTTHQLKALQKENQALKAKISHLISNAQQSESLMNRLLDMLTSLAVIKDEAFLSGFVNYVKKHFKSDYFKLLVSEGLVPENAIEDLEPLKSEHLKQFSVFQAKNEPLSGRIKKEKIQSVFSDIDDIRSAVVLPLGPKAQHGLLCFASKNEEKFHPNHASDILQKLSQILTTYFDVQSSSNENLAMS